MSDTGSNDREAQDIPGVATLFIPEDIAPQVVDFVAGLEADDTDVTGYMRGLGLNFVRLAETTQTVTNCKDTNGGKDTLCDNDTWITK